jgi:hypothetical protein
MDKVKVLISELEAKGFIERNRLYVGNLKSQRIFRCLKFVSMDVFSVNRESGRGRRKSAGRRKPVGASAQKP